ncbi:MAG: HIRAN domain-containing protein [Desulfobacterales bacterium]|nr:HIRAN domain-containing protein [Desulfobacterales bacterium]
MTSKIIVAWRNRTTHQWIPVATLYHSNNKYSFKYTNIAKKLNSEGIFEPFSNITDFDKLIESEEIFPIFKNRLMQKSRPEYNEYLNWLKLSKEGVSPIEELARSGGIRATDDLQLFPIPEKKNDMYEVFFFSHGIRYLPPNYIDRVNTLKIDDQLFIMPDIQNKMDVNAIVLRTDDPIEIVGYVPRLFACDFLELINSNGQKNVMVKAEQINSKSPSQFRLLCSFKTIWPENFKPFMTELFT